MRRLLHIAGWMVVFAATVYLGDALWVRIRQGRRLAFTRTVMVRVLLAVPQKGNRIEYAPGDTEPHVCTISLFPQLGLPPCWYLERHARRQIDY